MINLPDGVKHWPAHLDITAQTQLLDTIRDLVKKAPLFVPVMPRTGQEMSVRMTNFGDLGWVTDKRDGYRYQPCHPVSKQPWPPIPEPLLKLWDELTGFHRQPQACLVNYYNDDAKMGMHQDRDETNFDAPVLSISLGNDCLFRVGGTQRGGKTTGIRLSSGDVITLSGASRLAYHGVSKIYSGTSDLLKSDGRINLTLRVVD